MAIITSKTEREPDPTAPPLQVTFGRADNGMFHAEMSFGGLHPYTSAALLVEAALSILREAGAPAIAQLMLASYTQMLWENVPDHDQPPTPGAGEPCPGCGEVHS